MFRKRGVPLVALRPEKQRWLVPALPCAPINIPAFSPIALHPNNHPGLHPAALRPLPPNNRPCLHPTALHPNNHPCLHPLPLNNCPCLHPIAPQ